jgi:hypothetical protein
MEKQMECRLAGETEVLGENLPQRHFCPSQNLTWPEPGRRGGKPATNRLSYGAAMALCSCIGVIKLLLLKISDQFHNCAGHDPENDILNMYVSRNFGIYLFYSTIQKGNISTSFTWRFIAPKSLGHTPEILFLSWSNTHSVYKLIHLLSLALTQSLQDLLFTYASVWGNIAVYNMFALFSQSTEKRILVLMLFVCEARQHLLGLLKSVEVTVIFIMQFHITFTAWQIAYFTQTNPVKLWSSLVMCLVLVNLFTTSSMRNVIDVNHSRTSGHKIFILFSFFFCDYTFPLRPQWTWCQEFLFSGILRHTVSWKSTDAAEEHIAAIFRDKEKLK